jgi:hypothetical protein
MGRDYSVFFVYGAIVPKEYLQWIIIKTDDGFGKISHAGNHDLSMGQQILDTSYFIKSYDNDYLICFKEIEVEVARSRSITPIEVVDVDDVEVRSFVTWLNNKFPKFKYGEYLVISSSF